MEQPEGFKLPGKENKVWQLRKALYSLKQAGLSQWHTMTKSMLALGFKRYKSDAGVYYYHDKKTKALVIAIVYVDDVCFIGTKGSLLLNKLKQKFMARQECRDLGETTEFLGMHISCDHKNRKIFIDQYEYLEKVLVRFNVVTNPTHTLLPSEFSFKPNEKQCDPKFR